MAKGNITLTMIKPYAVQHGYVGPILARINEAGFRIAAMKYLQLSLRQAEAFYEVHRERPFFERLTRFMSNGPIVAAILEKENAVDDYRLLIGATDPTRAEEGTLRKLFGASIEQNAVHGSDSDDNAIREASFFFSELERF
ncbi:MAG: nucleoside-diphosphate kinase [Bacteroidales bacterium]|jgi:nucleoside-diphosphate kinase|nr:nucleoside-diphosphate kinase [Bacteroidales bacterium]NLM91319.1 nucleoside-diphosphate kinase [Bacteroidales bacterium]